MSQPAERTRPASPETPTPPPKRSKTSPNQSPSGQSSLSTGTLSDSESSVSTTSTEASRPSDTIGTEMRTNAAASDVRIGATANPSGTRGLASLRSEGSVNNVFLDKPRTHSRNTGFDTIQAHGSQNRNASASADVSAKPRSAGSKPTAIPEENDESQVVTTQTRPYMTAELAQRCNILLNFTNDDKAYYSLRSFDKNAAHWGPKTNGVMNKSQYLCRKKDDSLITFWIFGEIERTFFVTKEGQPPRKAGLNIVPLHASDLVIAQDLLRNFSNPPPASAPDENIWISRWQTARNSVDWFRRTYDATKALRNKSAMDIIDPTHLNCGDLVLVEAYINRYTPTPENNEGTPRKYQRQGQGWDRWVAQFELLAVSRIFEADNKPEEDDGLDLGI